MMTSPDSPTPPGEGPSDRRPPVRLRAAAPADAELERLVQFLDTEHGLNLHGYKRSTLYRRMRKRITDARRASVEEYLQLLRADPREAPLLVNTILINVTEFFRDPAAWEGLAETCGASLAAALQTDHPFRAWSVGCATGEEAYSLAILLDEFRGGGAPIRIFATDLDDGAVNTARAGVYEPEALRNVSAERLSRYFEALPEGRFRVDARLRGLVTFGRHNALADPPISRLDLLVCRNLLIYFRTETQSQLLRRFHYSLKEGGILFLGKAETLLTRSALFRPLDPRHRLFERSPLPADAPPRY